MSQVSLLFKDRILSIQHLNQHQEFLIGHANDCKIHIDSLAVQAHHAKIAYIKEKQNYKIIPIDKKAPIFINNHEVNNESDLSDGDHIKLGKHTLVFTFDERNEKHQAVAREPSPPVNKHSDTGWVQYLNGSKLGTTKQIKLSMMNIADEKSDNIALISNRHDGFYLSHLKGKPPKINKKSIGENSVRLENNTQIMVGDLHILFYMN